MIVIDHLANEIVGRNVAHVKDSRLLKLPPPACDQPNIQNRVLTTKKNPALKQDSDFNFSAY